MNHVIKKQIIALEINRGIDAFRLQQQVSVYYWKEMVPVLQQVFDAISSEDEIISVNRLEINLGYISEKSIENNGWGRELQSALQRKIGESLLAATPVTGVFRKHRAVNSCEQWLYYIRNGYLPWSVLSVDDAWYGQVLESLATEFSSVQYLRDLLLTSPNTGKRIVEQHAVDFLISLTEVLTARKQPDLSAITDELFLFIHHTNKRTSGLAIASEDRFKKDIWSQLLVMAANDPGQAPLSFRFLRSFFHQHALYESVAGDKVSAFPVIRSFIESGAAAAPFTEEKKQGNCEMENKSNEPGDNDIFVCHAGMVLLHPFLGTFFHRLSLMQEEDFVDRDSRLKALYLLHYLVTGNKEANEYELVVAKLLCAWPLHEPVEKEVRISDEELAESEELLLAVIQQWDILKNTSPAGLREGFLQRNGKLGFRNGNIYLQVEMSGIDMLLDHLPWNLGTIKLPWMDEIIKVEWR